mgnify:CR=1 FL=1
MQIVVDFDAANLHLLQFREGNVPPLGIDHVAVEYGVAKEEVITVILNNVPVASSDEKM